MRIVFVFKVVAEYCNYDVAQNIMIEIDIIEKKVRILQN